MAFYEATFEETVGGWGCSQNRNWSLAIHKNILNEYRKVHITTAYVYSRTVFEVGFEDFRQDLPVGIIFQVIKLCLG